MVPEPNQNGHCVNIVMAHGDNMRTARR